MIAILAATAAVSAENHISFQDEPEDGAEGGALSALEEVQLRPFPFISIADAVRECLTLRERAMRVDCLELIVRIIRRGPPASPFQPGQPMGDDFSQ